MRLRFFFGICQIAANVMTGTALLSSFPRQTSHLANAFHTLLARRRISRHISLRCGHQMTPCLCNRGSALFRAGRTQYSSSSENTRERNQINEDEARSARIERLHFHLEELGVEADLLSEAAFRSVTTTDGFDPKFGKSAIKAYRSYIDPKSSRAAAVARENVEVSSHRFARQIDFLAKRHRSREAEWVRHADTAERRRTFPLVLVLDNVRSAANVGSLFRSADACGCREILTVGLCPRPGGGGAEKLAKSALGAERVVPSRHFANARQAVEFLREERPGLRLVGMETTARSRPYTEPRYPGPPATAMTEDEDEGGAAHGAADAPGVALFLGNEVSGVDTAILPLLDEVVEIPMFGTKNSLNVAAAAPVVMYEILRQWGASK